MKKFLTFGILFAFLSAGLVFAQTAEENFEKVAQAELAKRGAILTGLATEIETFHTDMANDAVITGEEMRTLSKMINHFDRTKEILDKELKFYKKATQTEISVVIREHQDIYFNGFFTYSDNDKQEIRQYFVEKAGVDVIVEKSKDVEGRIFWGLLMGLILGIFLGAMVAFSTDSGELGFWFGLVVFSVTLALFLVL